MANAANSLLVLLGALELGLFFFMLILASAIRIVPENLRLSVFRFGRHLGDFGPGLVFLYPFGIDRAIRVDVSDQVQRALDH